MQQNDSLVNGYLLTCRAKSSQVARPIPRAAPVTKTLRRPAAVAVAVAPPGVITEPRSPLAVEMFCSDILVFRREAQSGDGVRGRWRCRRDAVGGGPGAAGSEGTGCSPTESRRTSLDLIWRCSSSMLHLAAWERSGFSGSI